MCLYLIIAILSLFRCLGITIWYVFCMWKERTMFIVILKSFLMKFNFFDDYRRDFRYRNGM